MISDTHVSGCHIDELKGTLEWHSASLADREESGTLAFKGHKLSFDLLYHLEYPILCQVKPNHKHTEFTITHLADKDEPQRTFDFQEFRFIKFVVLNGIHAEARIAFLAHNFGNGDLCLIIMRHDRSFQKSSKRALHRWSLQKFTLSPF